MAGLFARLADGHVPPADVDPAWVAAQVAHDPLAAPLGARFLGALADRIGASPGSWTRCLSRRPRPRVPV
jgi:hypothetical protein